MMNGVGTVHVSMHIFSKIICCTHIMNGYIHLCDNYDDVMCLKYVAPLPPSGLSGGLQGS